MEKIIKQNKYNINEDDILTQIENEYNLWYEAVSEKRRIREDDIRDKYVPLATDDKINIHSIYTAVQTLMSIHFSDSMIVEFAARRKNQIEKAAQINRLAEFDYSEMKLEKLDYIWNFDRFFHWVWIKVIDGWDKYTQTPVAHIVNPLSWIPDPRWWFTIDDHRWAWFEVEDTKEWMKAKWYMNVDLVNDKPADRQDDMIWAYKEGRNIIENYIEDTPNKKYAIYHHYTCIEWYKYLITTANHFKIILRMVRLEPVLKEEKDNPLKVLFPIALKYYSPVKWDPIGISVPDLLKDKQSNESKLFNLTLITATRNALWDDKIYNPKKIRNIKDLQTPTIEGKYIAANINDWENLGSVIMNVPKDNVSSLPFDVQSALRFQSSISTWMDSNTLWIQGEWNQTATEAQITQKNANLRFILWTKVGKWGEDSFWKLWYRSYIYNLKTKAKKAIRIQKGFGNQFYEIWRKDFITSEHIDVKIISKSEKTSLRNQQKNDFFAIAPQILWDPSTPTVSKLYTKRKMYRLAWLDEEEVQRLSINVDERLAYLDAELINNNQPATKPKKGQDHLIYIDILNTADDNKYKAEAITDREAMYFEEQNDILNQLTQWEWWQDNTSNNIAQSNASSKMSANMIEESKNASTPSLENVMQ